MIARACIALLLALAPAGVLAGCGGGHGTADAVPKSTPEITPPLQPLYDLYSFRIVPFLGQVVAGDRDAYSYLVESIRRFPRQSELAEMIAGAGLDQVKFRNLTGGVAALHSAWRL